MAEHLIGGGTITTSIEPEGEKIYIQAEIEGMTKANILALGTQLGYIMETTEENTKEQIVVDFMEQQKAAQGE